MLTLVWNWIVNWIFGWGGLGGLISVALWAAWYFSPLAKQQLLHAAIIATAVTISATYFFTSGYNTGYATAINQVAAKNKEATDAVNKVTSSVDECFNSGGTFDDVSGVCAH